MAPSSSAGGAAAAGGTNFEARVAGWYAAHMLAEAGAPSIPGHASTAMVTYVRCQTGEAIDDILVGFSDGAHDFVQAKRSLSLEESEESELAKSLDQCVRQFHTSQQGTGERPWDRPLDFARDRMVLAVGPTSSKPIREDLRAVLDRARSLVETQPLVDAAVNAAEKHALEVAMTHLRRSWTSISGNAPTEAELRTLMRHISVTELDVEGNGASAREALLLLRSSVVRDPQQDAVAWATICTTTANLAQARSGIDRGTLEASLRDAAIKLRGVRSYETDVARLQASSKDALGSLERYASFESGGFIVRLPRTVTTRIITLAGTHSFAIVGDPGGGKSASVFEAASALSDQPGVAVAVLQAVDVAARNFGELRQHLGLEHELLDVLGNWSEADRGILFIDALDAARDEPAARVLRELIAHVLRTIPRWRIIASIRSFDLKQGTQFQDVFRGSLPDVPPAFQRAEFARSRHVFVPRLTDDEIATVADLAPLMRPLILSASGTLRELLRVPFNIQLLAHLLDDGIELTALQPLRTQGELLDLYWQHRVRRDAQADARETLLRRICEQMIAKRQLRADRSALNLQTDGSHLLHDLLSEHVLLEVPGHHSRFVSFAHHVLFDYAAARLILPVEAADLASYLASDPALLFVLRPSLVFAFHERWRHSRSDFWEATLRLIQDSGIPAIGHVIGPVTAVDLASDGNDWEPLFATLADETRPEAQHAATKAIQFVVGSLLAASERPIVGPDAGPWSALAERIAAQLQSDLTGPLRALLFALTDKLSLATTDDKARIGRAARLLLQYVELELPTHRQLLVAGLTLVARTAATDVAATAMLLRGCLAPDRVQQFGYEELPTLAREVEELIEADPLLVADLYATTFSFVDESQDATQIGSSAILPLTSNRAQDYRSAFYSLAQAFPAFFARSPLDATRALVRSIDGYVLWRHPSRSGEVIEASYDHAGMPIRIRTDYSAIWDKSPHDDAQKLLIDFEKGLLALADAGDVDALDAVLQVIVSENRMAAVWRRVLRAGVLRPEVIGVRLVPLLQQPMFLAYDTWRLAAQLLCAVYPHITNDARSALEEMVLSIAADGPEETREGRKRARDEIAKLLPRDLLETEPMRALVDQLAPPSPAGQPPAALAASLDDDEIEVGWLSADEALALEGVNVSEPANARMRALTAPVEEFATANTNTDPSEDAVAQIVPQVEALQAAVANAATDGVHPELVKRARVAICEACSVLPKCRTLAVGQPALQLARTVLLRASTSDDPVLNEQVEASWNTQAGWSPADRIEAAQGLLYLARRAETCDEEILDAIERLAADPVAAVRYQIGQRLLLLYYTAPDRMWALLESRIAQEERGGVALGLMGCLNDLKRADESRVAALIVALIKRIESSVPHEVVELGVQILAVLAIWPATPLAQEFIAHVIDDTRTDPETAGAILRVIREPFAYGAIDDPKAADVRARAFATAKALLERALDVYRSEIHARDFSTAGQSEIAHARSIVGMIDGIARELYFASGAHDVSQGARPRIDEARQRRFYAEAAPLFDLLIATGLAPATHSLLETLEAMIPFEPEEVFFRIQRLLRAGHDVGYSQESQAINLVVRVVERYLADYRHLFQANAELRAALSEILSLFIEAGWPQALRLASRLEEIFR